MRADRLLQLILLLQTRGRMPAWRLAQELEVSERTVYRDIAALSTAGIPVYGEAGPQGGFSLVDSYRTSLTGLSAGEAQALFMLNVPEPLRLLGLDEALKTALLKLSAALPAYQADEEYVRRRFYLDTAWWPHATAGQNAAPHLHTVHQAVWQDRCLQLRLRRWSVEVERVVQPYALASKAGEWYLVGAGQGRLRVYRVAELLDARLLLESFERRPDFDLPAFWEAWCAETESRPAYRVQVRVSPELLPLLPLYLAERFRRLPEPAPEADGWTTLELSFESFTDARSRLLGMGRAVEVLAPEPLRRSLADFARQIVELYRAED